jgi:hypothetical protein
MTTFRLFACFSALIAASPAIAQPDFSGRDSHWIKDEASGCWAANPDPEPLETITWTGQCRDMLVSGTGTLSWYLDGRLIGRDEGNFVRGELSGHGKITFADGSNFEGEFPGRGVLTLPGGNRIDAVSVKESAGWSIEQAR